MYSWFLKFVLIALALLFVAGCGDDAPAPVDVMQQPVFATVDAGKLLDEFGVNEAAASEKYKDKIIEVSGTVVSVTGDIGLIVHLGVGDSSYVSGVFEDSEKADVLKLRKGQEVLIRGVYDNDLAGIALHECKLVPASLKQ